VAYKVHWLALRYKCDVIYLTLVDDLERMLSVSRYMATMKATTSDQALHVDWEIVETSHWLEKLQTLIYPGDILGVQEEQNAKIGFLQTIPLEEFLKTKFKNQVISIFGFYHPEKEQIARWLHSLLFWAGIAIIMAIFTLLEIRIDQGMQGVGRSVILMVMIGLELGSIFAWNNYTSR
jgi:hypothetical protein